MQIIPPEKLSLLAVSSELNITAHNQGDNCIVARSGDKLISEPNQTLLSPEAECQKNFDYNMYPNIKGAVGCWLGSLPGLEESHTYSPGENECDPLNALLIDLKDLQVIKLALLQGEVQRLKKKLGADHPRVRQVEKRLKQNLNLIQNLEVEVELAKIRVPKVPNGGALLHGRIADRSNRGIAGLIVFAEDDTGNRLRESVSETDASGYYAFQLGADILEKLKNRKVYLTVSTKTGKTAHIKHEPLVVEADKSLIANITLDRSFLHPIKQQESQSSK